MWLTLAAVMFHLDLTLWPPSCFGKISSHKSTYTKVWVKILWFYRENLWGKCLSAKLRFVPGLPRYKSFGKGQFNPIIDSPTCHMLRFQAYEVACIFLTSLCDITGYASVKGTSLSLGLCFYHSINASPALSAQGPGMVLT